MSSCLIRDVVLCASIPMLMPANGVLEAVPLRLLPKHGRLSPAAPADRPLSIGVNRQSIASGRHIPS
jgi:hypothetical protein